MSDLNQVIADYGAAWQETDGDARLNLLKRCFSENGRYVDPTAQVTGRDALNAHIGAVLQSSNGRVEITSQTVSHHNVAHFTWHMVGKDGAKVVDGHDFVQLDADGRIASLTGFFGSPEPLT